MLQQIDAQIESLRRQAKQSTRYRGLAAEIRRHEALSKLIAWREHEAAFAEAERRLEADVRDVAERTRAQAEAARLQAIAAAALPSLRDAEARAGAALHRLVLAREALEGEEKRAEARAAELQRRVEQLSQDLSREESLIADAADVAERLAQEDQTLAAGSRAPIPRRRRPKRGARRRKASSRCSKPRSARRRPPSPISTRGAMPSSAGLMEETRRLQRFEGELAAIERERAALPGVEADEAAFRDAAAALESLSADLAAAEAKALAAEAAHAEAREAEARTRAPLSEAERHAQRLETETRTLTKLLGSSGGGQWPPVVDSISVARGYEAALGAALGDDLDASTEAGAPAHWSAPSGTYDDPALPAGVESLASRVEAPRGAGAAARADRRCRARRRPRARARS